MLNFDVITFCLFQIIYRTTLDHPYHCLYVILALSNASKDNLYPTAGHVTGMLRNQGGREGGRLQRKQSAVGGSVDEVNRVPIYSTVTSISTHSHAHMNISTGQGESSQYHDKEASIG